VEKDKKRTNNDELISPKVPITTQTRPFDVFVVQQNAKGDFKLNSEFISSAGLKNNLNELVSNMPSILIGSSVSDKTAVWATVIALVVFEITFSDLRDEWELIYEKSKKFVTSQLKGLHITLPLLQEAAKKILKWK